MFPFLFYLFDYSIQKVYQELMGVLVHRIPECLVQLPELFYECAGGHSSLFGGVL